MRLDIHALDITVPLRPLTVAEGADGVALLLRDRRRPIGFVMLERDGGVTIHEDELEQIVVREAGTVLLEGRIRDQLAPAAPPARETAITLAICTRDRPHLLARCLDSIAALERGGGAQLDVLVVDNAPSDDRTATLVQARPGTRYVREPLPGLDFARNRALAEARGELIAFLDDDVRLDAHWLHALLDVAACNPDAAAFTGLLLPAELETRAQILFERRGGFGRGFRQRRFRGDTRLDNCWYPCGAGIFGAGANMAFRTRVVRGLGGFDEALDAGAPLPGGGDLDIFFRILRSGHSLVYEPSLLAFHHHRRGMRELRRQYRSWGDGFMAFVSKTHATDPALRPRMRGLVRWWFADQVRQLGRSLRHFRTDPPDLHLAELLGGMVGLTGSYRRSRSRTAELRRAAGLADPTARTAPVGPLQDDTHASWRVVHVDLARGVPGLQGDGRNVSIVFWWHDIPLGRCELAAGELPVPAAHVLHLAAETIAPAVGKRVLSRGFEAPLPIPQHRQGRELPSLGELAALTQPLRDVRVPVSHAPLSVVICTRDRPDSLRRTLASLVASAEPPAEIVVVDNGRDTDAMRAVLRAFPRVRCIREDRPGLSRARNCGVAHSTHDLIAFTDDDVEVHPQWTRRLAGAFDDPSVLGVTGLVLPASLGTEAQHLFERGFGGFGQGYRMLRFTPSFLDAMRAWGPPVWRIGAGASMAFRRAAFGRTGGFDERLGAGAAGCSEDSELWYRILAAGGTIVYEPGAVVHHHHRATLAELRQQLRAYMRGHVTALAIQYARHGHAGNLYRLFIGLPRYYAGIMVRGHDSGSLRDRRIVLQEMRGALSGMRVVLASAGGLGRTEPTPAQVWPARGSAPEREAGAASVLSA